MAAVASLRKGDLIIGIDGVRRIEYDDYVDGKDDIKTTMMIFTSITHIATVGSPPRAERKVFAGCRSLHAIVVRRSDVDEA